MRTHTRERKKVGTRKSAFFQRWKGRLRSQGAFQHKGILKVQGRKRGPEVKCETVIRDMLGNWRESSADGSHCFSIPLNWIQGKIVQKWRVCGRGC